MLTENTTKLIQIAVMDMLNGDSPAEVGEDGGIDRSLAEMVIGMVYMGELLDPENANEIGRLNPLTVLANLQLNATVVLLSMLPTGLVAVSEDKARLFKGENWDEFNESLQRARRQAKDQQEDGDAVEAFIRSLPGATYGGDNFDPNYN
jgi:hypothetical protein